MIMYRSRLRVKFSRTRRMCGRKDVRRYAHMCTVRGCASLRGDGDAPQWIFQFHVVFSFAHRRFHPPASSFGPGLGRSPPPRSGSLTSEVCAACLCTAVIYSLFSGIRLLSRRRIAGRVEVNQEGVAANRSEGAGCGVGGRNLSISNPPSVVNSSIYRHGIRCIARRLESALLVTRLAAGAGSLGKLHSSHTELILRGFSKRVRS